MPEEMKPALEYMREQAQRKLAELQKLFLAEAERYGVLPMDDRRLELFDPRMKEIIPVDPNDPDGQLLADGDLMLARGFFLAMVQGTEQIVETHGQIRSQFDDEEEALKPAELVDFVSQRASSDATQRHRTSACRSSGWPAPHPRPSWSPRSSCR